MRVLVVGNGGREHAMAWRLRQSASVSQVICPNGNPGIATVAECPSVVLKTNEDWVAFAKQVKADLVAVGPEAPLAAGVGEAIRGAGIPVFGPNRDGALLEASKTFAKEIMAAAGVPTARAETFTDAAKAKDFAKSLGLPVVIKADGLAAGKGVTVAETWEQAVEAIEENLLGGRFGESSAKLLIEEFMEGEEASIFGLCDGKTVFPMVPSQDHKRAYDGDKGPNTGGMGAYAPAPLVSFEVETAVFGEVLMPTLKELQRRGIDYRGVLYAGLMITKDGPKVVEYNARFGDPETQVVLPLLDGDFGEILLACAEGRLGPLTMAAKQGDSGQTTGIGTKPQHAATVVLASGGYPGNYTSGKIITGLDQWIDVEGAMVFHAGTAYDSAGNVVTNGGRVLACTAWDVTLEAAVKRAYEIADSIEFEGKHIRRDIGHRALN